MNEQVKLSAISAAIRDERRIVWPSVAVFSDLSQNTSPNVTKTSKPRKPRKPRIRSVTKTPA